MKRIKQIQEEIEMLTKLLEGEPKPNLWMQGEDGSFIEGELEPFTMLRIDP